MLDRQTFTGPIVSVASGLPRPRWRGWVHTWAFVITLPAVIALMLVAGNALARVSVGIYGVGLAAVFGVSASYHRLARSERAQHFMRRADHATVFVKIAATYTPVCLLALPRGWGISLLSAAWGIAVLGVGFKLFAPRRIISYASVLYLVIGWVALVGLPVIARSLTGTELVLLVVGGVVYTVGAVAFWLRVPDPLPTSFGYHEVWHAMTVVAAVAHFAMVWSVVSAA